MKGWKTWAGFALVVVSTVLKMLGYGQEAEIIGTIGGAGLAVGIAHKIEKRR